MLTVQLKNCENAAGACEGVGNVKEAVKHLCVHSEKKRREIIQKENNITKRRVAVVGVLVGAGRRAIEGIVFPLGPSLAPARSLRGSPGS